MCLLIYLMPFFIIMSFSSLCVTQAQTNAKGCRRCPFSHTLCRHQVWRNVRRWLGFRQAHNAHSHDEVVGVRGDLRGAHNRPRYVFFYLYADNAA